MTILQQLQHIANTCTHPRLTPERVRAFLSSILGAAALEGKTDAELRAIALRLAAGVLACAAEPEVGA